MQNLLKSAETDSAAMAEVKAEFIWLNPDAANDNSPHGGSDGTFVSLSASADGGGYAPLAVAVPGTTAGTTQITWVHGNHLGVPQLVMNAAGTAIVPTGYSLPGYPGQSRTLADLYYNRYRDYDSSTGRYIQADPIGLAGGSNVYGYAEGNPITGIDPLGLFSLSKMFGSGSAGSSGNSSCNCGSAGPFRIGGDFATAVGGGVTAGYGINIDPESGKASTDGYFGGQVGASAMAGFGITNGSVVDAPVSSSRKSIVLGLALFGGGVVADIAGTPSEWEPSYTYGYQNIPGSPKIGFIASYQAVNRRQEPVTLYPWALAFIRKILCK
jgi:RHS repeat-associated protein